ncbi:MAG TPA: zinc-binding dehydrogenase [Candidatus Methylacidiphilales bacterium]|nr:zinc-binding dehydrogenase [Candidatus Methylacidiphilales bacterium]
MKAIQLRGFGGIENFNVTEVADVRPGPTQLAVKVRATSVNPLDIQTRRGDYRDQITLPAIIGNDVSGQVIEVGSMVTGWKAGDEVFYFAPIFDGNGTYAEIHVIDAELVVHKPARLNHAEAASLPLAATTAWTALHERAALKPGETVVIHAGAGGVGSLAIQLARIAGARVLTTCRPENEGLVRSLGADETIDYRTTDWISAVLDLTQGRGADVVFDTVGGDTLSQAPRGLAACGRLVTIVDTAKPQNLLAAWERNLRYDFVFAAPDADKLRAIAELAERGTFIPVIDSKFPISHVGAAHAHVEAGGVKGKVVLSGF